MIEENLQKKRLYITARENLNPNLNHYDFLYIYIIATVFSSLLSFTFDV